MARVHKFDFETTDSGVVRFAGETVEEALSYVEKAGFTVVGEGVKVNEPEPEPVATGAFYGSEVFPFSRY